MLTPAFELSQEDDFLTLIIKARFARVSETEIFVDGRAFKFYSKPYFLRLTLPGALIEDGRETANYDSDKGFFTIRVPKETPGENFDGLDMLTQLMAPSGATSASEPSIEKVDAEEADKERHGQEKEDEEEDEEISWEVDQTVCLVDEDEIVGPVTYGFASRRSGVFSRLQEELCSIVDVPDPDHMTAKERREARKQEEVDKFDDEHYLADLYQDDMIRPLLDYKPSWQKVMEDHQDQSEVGVKPSAETVSINFTEAERDRILKLPRKEFLLDKTMGKEAYMGLLDIIYAYAYNHRITEGDSSVESAWTICKLSSTLSWLDTHSTPRDVLVSSLRRSLCYPLHRHWELAITTLQDVKTIFHLGRNQILKALLETHRLLAVDDPRYILNELYITDYCVWIQTQPHQKIKEVALAVDKVKILKENMELDLEELEAAARCVLEENGQGEASSPPIKVHGYPHLLRNIADDQVGDVHASDSSPGTSESEIEKTNDNSSENAETTSDEGDTKEGKESEQTEDGSEVLDEARDMQDTVVNYLGNEMASLMIERSRNDAMETKLDSDDDSNG